MRRSGLAVAAAVMLSMVPAAPPVLAAPISFYPAVMTSDSGSLIEVNHRRKFRKSCTDGWVCHRNHVRIHRRHHHFHGHHHSSGVCIWFSGIRICF
jgi:hypothetical protein